MLYLTLYSENLFIISRIYYPMQKKILSAGRIILIFSDAFLLTECIPIFRHQNSSRNKRFIPIFKILFGTQTIYSFDIIHVGHDGIDCTGNVIKFQPTAFYLIELNRSFVHTIRFSSIPPHG